MKPFVLNIVSAAFLITLGLGAGANAAECKGSAKASCMTNSSCSWVDAYKRADGKNVKGYCRMAKAKAKDKASAKKAAAMDKMSAKKQAAKDKASVNKTAAKDKAAKAKQ